MQFVQTYPFSKITFFRRLKREVSKIEMSTRQSIFSKTIYTDVDTNVL